MLVFETCLLKTMLSLNLRTWKCSQLDFQDENTLKNIFRINDPIKKRKKGMFMLFIHIFIYILWKLTEKLCVTMFKVINVISESLCFYLSYIVNSVLMFMMNI